MNNKKFGVDGLGQTLYGLLMFLQKLCYVVVWPMFRDLGCILPLPFTYSLVQNLLNSTLGDTLLEGAALRDFAKPFYPFLYYDTAFEEK